MGREIAGEIVAVAPVIACGECYYCLRDLENLCAGRKALGYEYDGGFAESLRVPAPAASYVGVDLVSLCGPESVRAEQANRNCACRVRERSRTTWILTLWSSFMFQP